MAVRGFGWPAILGADGTVELRGTKQAALLAVLTTGAGEVVSSQAIVNDIWAGRATSVASLRVAMSRLRQQFVEVTGSNPIHTTSLGYTLAIDRESIDVHRYRAAAAATLDAHGSSDTRNVIVRAGIAERIWTGRPFDGVDDVRSVDATRSELDDLRAQVDRAHATARLVDGDALGARSILERVTADDPYREDAWALLAITLAHERRPADALAALSRLRTTLWDELGVHPSAEIETLEHELRERRPPAELGVHLLHGPARPHRDDAHGPRTAVSSRVTRSHPDVTIVGRDPELAELAALTERCEASRRLTIVDLVGPPGVGKTALVHAWLDREREGGREVRYGAAGPEGAIPFEAVLHAVPEARGPDRSSAAVSRSALLERVVQAVATLARSRTVVLALDDAHFYDLATVACLRHLTERLAHQPVLVVRPRRPTPANDWSIPGDHRLELAPLGPDEISTIVRSVAPTASDDETARIVEVAAGIAGFAVELATRPDQVVPRSAAELAVRRRAHLDPLAADIVDLVAVAGRSIGIPELADLLDTEPRTIAKAAAAAVERSALVDRDGLDFAHDLYRAGTLDALSPLRRRALHAQLAHHLASRTTATTRECALHAIAAGDAFGPRRRSLVAQAAVVSAFGVDPEGALELCDQVPATPPHAPEDDARIALARGIANASLGDGHRARGELADALALARSASDPRLIAEVVFAHRLFGVPVDDALGLMTSTVIPALELQGDDGWLLRAVWAAVSFGQGHAEVVDDLCRRARAVAERIGSPAARTMATHAEVVASFVCGRPAHHRERLAVRGVELAAGGAEPLLEHLHLGALAAARMAQGNLRATRDVHECLLALPATQALALARNLIDARVATILICEGHLEEAEERIGAVWHQALELGRSDATLTFAAQFFVLRWAQGRLREVLDEIDRLREIESNVPASFGAALAMCHAIAGRAAVARALLDRLDVDLAPGRPDLVTITLATTARWHLGDPVDAEWATVIEPFADEHAIADMSSAVTFGPVRRTIALIAASNGEIDRARAMLGAVRATCDVDGHVAFARIVEDDLAVLDHRSARSG